MVLIALQEQSGRVRNVMCVMVVQWKMALTLMFRLWNIPMFLVAGDLDLRRHGNTLAVQELVVQMILMQLLRLHLQMEVAIAPIVLVMQTQ